MTRKKGKSTPINYAAIIRSSALAEKILKYSDSEAGETNKQNDLMILSVLVELKKRLEDLSKKTHSGKIISKAIKRYNRKAPAGKAFTEAEIADKREDSCERDYTEACSIFNEAADAGIGLPSVPAVDGTSWSFMILQNWCNESSRKISSKLQKYVSKITSGSKAGGTKKNKKKLKLLTEKATTEYSFPLPMTKWAIIFGVSENKLRELRKEKKYHFDQISKRKWRLPRHEIPTEYLEKYRQERNEAQ